MKTAFQLTVLLALASACGLALQLIGVLPFTIANFTLQASGLCGSGILALAISDYAPRHRIRLDRAARRTLRRENAAPNQTAEAATATWGYQTISA